MAQLTCSVCGKAHDELDLALAYRVPGECFKVPEKERTRRIKIGSDLCSIDNKLFFIRSVLELPIKDTQETFEWGIWPLVNKKDFDHYVALWDANGVEKEPPIRGLLSGGIKYYPNSDMLEVTLHLRSNGKRPLVKVSSPDHPLSVDQREGISLEKAHNFFTDFLK